MAGRRKTKGRPARWQAREHRMTERMTRAQSPEQSAAAAFDWLRVTARHMADRNAAGRYLRDAAAYLSGAARDAGRSDGA